LVSRSLAKYAITQRNESHQGNCIFLKIDMFYCYNDVQLNNPQWPEQENWWWIYICIVFKVWWLFPWEKVESTRYAPLSLVRNHSSFIKKKTFANCADISYSSVIGPIYSISLDYNARGHRKEPHRWHCLYTCSSLDWPRLIRF
jgi:hypothetical protein